MEASGQGTQEGTAYQETEQQGQVAVQDNAQQEEYAITEEENQQKNEPHKSPRSEEDEGDRSSFIHGLAVGLGLGCIATFVIMWIAVFFTPKLPDAISYETMLSIFIYPLVYLLAVGLVALTAGIVREYYSVRHKL